MYIPNLFVLENLGCKVICDSTFWSFQLPTELCLFVPYVKTRIKYYCHILYIYLVTEFLYISLFCSSRDRIQL